MMRYKIISVVVLFIVLIAVSFILSCTQYNFKGVGKANQSSVYFDYFNYVGKDDFYNENKLPTIDSYYNPILPGWHSDPSICSNGSDYFLIASSFVYFPGVPIFHSTDLVNWKQIGHVLNRPSQLINMEGQHTSGGIFAPTIRYNPQNETYYMITTNVGAGNFFVKTKDPFGTWSDPIWLPEIHGIDPSFFFDENGKAYILNNDEPEGGSTYSGHSAIWIREFDIEKEKVFGPEKMLLSGGINIDEKPIWIQGAHMYKMNGYYYLMCAEGGNGTNHSEVILRSNKPTGNFIACRNNPILTQRHLKGDRANPITCAGHADLVKDNKGNWWSVFLANRPINGQFENLGRETFLLPVRWNSNGSPFITKDLDRVPMIAKRIGVTRGEHVTFGNFSVLDDFNEQELGNNWLTLRSSADKICSLTQKEGYLSLKMNTVSATDKKVPSFVCRKIQHHKFECTTKLKLSCNSKKEWAGILLYKDEQHQYFLAVNNANKILNISLQKFEEGGCDILAKTELQKKIKTLNLKVDSDGQHFNFYYAIKEHDWKLLLADVDAQFLSTSNAFGFTGTTIGMYANKLLK